MFRSVGQRQWRGVNREITRRQISRWSAVLAGVHSTSEIVGIVEAKRQSPNPFARTSVPMSAISRMVSSVTST